MLHCQHRNVDFVSVFTVFFVVPAFIKWLIFSNRTCQARIYICNSAAVVPLTLGRAGEEVCVRADKSYEE